MRQFHEAYHGQAILSPLVRELPWIHNLIILSPIKRPEEREFYLKMAEQEKWSKRELERQFDAALFERVVLSPAKVSPLVRQIHPHAASLFNDSYLVEFLDLPATQLESDLQRGLLVQLRQFLLELGRDFCFVGSEYASRICCSKKIPVSTSWSRVKAWARPSHRTRKKSICRRSSTA
jgi:predicted nuclease of restriction endonuclease-like (RecB) superfamily